MQPSLKFTVEKEKNGVLPFLDVKIEKSTNVYRKSTFTGLYTNWNSFEPTKRKTNLVGTLVHRELKICSKNKLQEELNQIRSILQQNGYPEIVIISSMKNKLSRFYLEPKEGPQRCPVNLKLPWIEKISLKFEIQIKSAVKKYYGTVEPRVLFLTRKLQPAIHKGALPSTHQCMVVYQYVCLSNCRYVGCTSQRLHDRIAQYIAKSIRNKSIPSRTLPTRDCKTKISSIHNCDSAIGLHLLQNDECAKLYNDRQFSILVKALTPFHLAVLEATYIKIHQPVLCRHKEFVYALQIPH